MANLILTTTGWEDRVRGLLGVDEAHLPDTVVQLADFINTAERIIIGVVPEYASLADAPTADPPTFERTWLESAAVCQCAALLCPAMANRLPNSEQGPSYTRQGSSNWSTLERKLLSERDMYLGKITGEDDVDAYDLYHFDLTGLS